MGYEPAAHQPRQRRASRRPAGELSHRCVLALYRLQQRLMDEFPDLLLENCCSGGGRFDPGMLFYSPQIWYSDDTDAIERLRGLTPDAVYVDQETKREYPGEALLHVGLPGGLPGGDFQSWLIHLVRR